MPASPASGYTGFVPALPQRSKRFNAFGWIALGLGLLDVVIAIVSAELPAWAPALIPASIGAFALAIVALILRSRRRASTLATPIIALVLSFLIAAAGTLAWAGSTTSHNELEAQSVTIPNNPGMTALFLKSRSIERGIRAQGSAYHWPESVSPDSAGGVSVGGKLLATLSPGETMSYQVTKGGEDFVLQVFGTVPGERTYYDLDTHVIYYYCGTGDNACDGS
jgi:hypothetical protein